MFCVVCPIYLGGFINYCTTANPIFAIFVLQVQELVGMGSALDYILDYPSAVGLQDFKLWGAQIASGMNYLEGKG